jgi:sugar/nucleoside kinase (ribokinase family)
VPVVADLDDLYGSVEALLPNIDFLITGRDIPKRMTGITDLRCSLPELQRCYGSRMTAATLGSDGVLAWDGRKFHYAAAYRVNGVDATGAGDIFHAGFVFGLVRGWPVQRQLEFACAAAGLNCATVGARGGIRRVEEIEELMARAERHAAVFELAAPQ